jgi:hypothetical protein
MQFSDIKHSIHQDNDKLILAKRQEIPDDFLSILRGVKDDSTDQRENTFMHVAAIPVAVHELWLARDNYDCTKEDIRTSVKKLKAEGLDAFVVTNKRV